MSSGNGLKILSHVVVKQNEEGLHRSQLKSLTLYYTILTFKDPKEEGFEKHWGVKEKMLATSIFSFSERFLPYQVEKSSF